MINLLDRAFGRGGILAYHGVATTPHIPAMHITPRGFRTHVEYLREHYSIVPLFELVERWRRGASTNGLVAITFDDAYAGVQRHAAPVLKELNVPATIFVTSGHAELGASYWWDDVELERLSTANVPWANSRATVGLGPIDASDPGAVESLRTRVLANFSGRWPEGIRPHDDPEWRSLRFDELEMLARDELFDFGVHTLTHPSLPSLPYAEQVGEMRDNFSLLRDRLPRVRPIVAYPYGLYDSATQRAAAEAGMMSGVTMEGRAPSASPNLFTVPRVGAGEAHNIVSVSRRLKRALRPVLILRNRSIHPRVPRAE